MKSRWPNLTFRRVLHGWNAVASRRVIHSYEAIRLPKKMHFSPLLLQLDFLCYYTILKRLLHAWVRFWLLFLAVRHIALFISVAGNKSTRNIGHLASFPNRAKEKPKKNKAAATTTSRKLVSFSFCVGFIFTSGRHISTNFFFLSNEIFQQQQEKKILSSHRKLLPLLYIPTVISTFIIVLVINQ